VVRVTTTGRAARLLLLLGTILGLAAMHTLGHAGMAATDHHAVNHHAGAAMTAPSMSMSISMAAAHECAGEHCPGGSGHHGLDGWSVCLAVLTGLALAAVLAVALLATAGGPGDRTGRSRPAGPPTRAPPSRSAGLTITTATVLRV
jgi:Family of unknown function (DUF6153)